MTNYNKVNETFLEIEMTKIFCIGNGESRIGVY